MYIYSLREMFKLNPYVNKDGKAECIDAYIETLAYYLAVERVGKITNMHDAIKVKSAKTWLKYTARYDGYSWNEIEKEANILIRDIKVRAV